jgi:hypothetical protein
MKSSTRSIKHLFPILFCFCILSCKKFVEVDPPKTDLVRSAVFSSNATADAAMLEIYYQLRSSGFAGGGISSISYLASLSSDEQVNFYGRTPEIFAEFSQFNSNNLIANNSYILSMWTEMFQCIYKCNAVIEGLLESVAVSDDLKNRLIGEAKFVRAFCHFYLVNLWGRVPLITSTDYKLNTSIPRVDTNVVYQQIVDDLQAAIDLLPDDYSLSSGERARANKYVARALLARVYLYTKQWADAETQATYVIDAPDYELVADLSLITQKNNSESILQLWSDDYPGEIFIFYIFSTPVSNCALRNELVSVFDANDFRRSVWIGEISDGTTNYYFAKKYSSFVQAAEYSTVMRLAEQYLIRAEARAEQNKLTGINSAESDLNVIRNRAFLPNISNVPKDAMIDSILVERKRELFTEWGHRWFDLKRLNRVDDVLTPLRPGWNASKALFPIPQVQMLNDPAMKNDQNPGYE